MRTGTSIGWMLSALFAICVACGGLAAGAQEPAKIALLIGNQKYESAVGELRNPHNDIRIVGVALTRQGFTVLPPVKDARRSAILGAVRELARRLNAGGTGAVGFLYYSGHGAAESDTNINYLIPVDAHEPGSSAFWDDSVKLDDIIKLLDGARSAAKFIVFDACRNELRMPTKGSTKGFVPVSEQQGMFIAYASAAGRTASDAGTESGPYAAALAAELSKPGLDHLSLFQNVKEAVFTKTGGAQQPWESNGLFRRVYLTGQPKQQQATQPAQAAPSEALQTWTMIKDSSNRSVLEAFVKQFGDTVFGAMARARIEELDKQKVAAATPPPQPPAAPAPPTKPAASITPATPYPTGPITIVVPFAAGGATDVLARIVSDGLTKTFGVQVIVENRAGAAGMIGAAHIAKAKADGTQLLIGGLQTHAIAANRALLSSEPPYDGARDFEPISLLASLPMMLVTKSNAPFGELKKFLDYAKANPGKLTFGSGGIGTSSHLACALLSSVAGIDVVQVPYRGTAPALIDLSAGTIDFMCEAVATMLPQIRAGTLKPLGVLDERRSPLLPDVPTMGELGFKIIAPSWNGLFAPKGTSPHIVKRLHDAALDALSTQEIQGRLTSIGFVVPAPNQTSADFLGTYVRSEIDKWGTVIKTVKF